jgi:hypothetical protein
MRASTMASNVLATVLELGYEAVVDAVRPG